MDRRVEGQTEGDRQAEPAPGTAAGTDLSALLPDDVLADVLRRVAPRDLAASRCVCKAWRAAVDARRLLRAELLPLSLGGIFINFHNYYITEFFSRPSTATRPSVVSGKHDYLPVAGAHSWGSINDHCNGLLLVDAYDEENNSLPEFVLNPATRWFAPLPPCPPLPLEPDHTFEEKYLVYDPTVSPHYEVFSIPRFCYNRVLGDLYNNSKDKLNSVTEQSEWPPSVFTVHVFSSRTGRWEERSFVREGEGSGTVAHNRDSLGNQHNAVYWRGALYVHYHNDLVMRISLSNDKYQVIKLPEGIQSTHYPYFCLGKSEKGVYCASIHGWFRIQVWVLDESSCEMEWVLRHDKNLVEWLVKHKLEYERPTRDDPRVHGPWSLQDINSYYDGYNKDGNKEVLVEENFEWSSEASVDENFAWSSDSEEKDEDFYSGYMNIIGFHPYKEIIFLSESITRGLAYHLNTSKVEVLGHLYPARYDEELGNEQLIRSSFPYMPCLLRETTDKI